MATYKVWLTVKDSYGNIKEIPGDEIRVDLATLSPDEINQIEEQLPLEEYLRKDEVDTELERYATDVEVDQKTKDSIKYAGFFDEN
jgi:myosin-crossreactive antigen